MKTDLSRFNNSWYKPGSAIRRILWQLASLLFFQNGLFVFSGVKVRLLRLFGGTIGHGVVLKPNVLIKYPWKLSIGDYTWVGEGAWIDNLAPVTIGSNVCISQGAYLLTGNHDFKSTAFDLLVKPIVLEDGAWVGAKSVVCPGVVCHSHAVLTVGSVATSDLEPYAIYQGNPAKKVKDRVMNR